MHVGLVGEQCLDYVWVTLRDRPHERRLAASLFGGVHVGAGGEQLFDDCRAAAVRRCHQQRLAGQQCRVRVRADLEQDAGHLRTAVLARRPERRHPEVGHRVGVGTRVQQQRRHVTLVPVAGPVQGGGPVPLWCRDVRPLLDQRANRGPVGRPCGLRHGLRTRDGSEAEDRQHHGPDLSANGHHLTQSSSTLVPVCRTSGGKAYSLTSQA